MKKYCVLQSGPSLVADKELFHKLQEIADVFKNLENSQIEAILSEKKVDLILLEISKDHISDVEIIKGLKSQYPKINIILIDGDGDREVIAQAFNYGARDAFRKPYNSTLIVERVNTLLRGL